MTNGSLASHISLSICVYSSCFACFCADIERIGLFVMRFGIIRYDEFIERQSNGLDFLNRYTLYIMQKKSRIHIELDLFKILYSFCNAYIYETKKLLLTPPLHRVKLTKKKTLKIIS